MLILTIVLTGLFAAILATPLTIIVIRILDKRVVPSASIQEHTDITNPSPVQEKSRRIR